MYCTHLGQEFLLYYGVTIIITHMYMYMYMYTHTHTHTHTHRILPPHNSFTVNCHNHPSPAHPSHKTTPTPQQKTTPISCQKTTPTLYQKTIPISYQKTMPVMREIQSILSQWTEKEYVHVLYMHENSEKVWNIVRVHVYMCVWHIHHTTLYCALGYHSSFILFLIIITYFLTMLPVCIGGLTHCLMIMYHLSVSLYHLSVS